jgi:wyosine [tRNA(Phe)-imidazoG37] synthetase (radical SAM superfamily)
MNEPYKYIFGPVPSRRLGLSLGIDLLGNKICSMDCIYCEVGKTKILTLKRDEYVPTESVLRELQDFIINLKGEKPNYITFSGMGEPTLHSRLGYIIDKIHEMTDIPVCVLTNSTTIVLDEVFNELLKADVVIPSLDALREDTVCKLNKPVKGVNFQKIIQRLSDFKKVFKGKIFIEILFVKGVNDNDGELKVLNEAVKSINPDGLQIHTVARPSMAGHADPVSDSFLEHARNFFSIYSSKIEAFSGVNKAGYETETDMVTSLLKIRPCHFDEISNSTGISKDKLESLLKKLDESGSVTRINFNNLTYFKVVKDK